MTITLAGMRMLAQMKPESRPRNWKSEVLNYLELKERALELRRLKRIGYSLALEDYYDALVLAHHMGIRWLPNP